MKNSLETKLGIFVVFAVLATVFIIEMLGGLEMFQGGYHVSALFDTVQDLKVGDSAKMAGVEIGKVEKIAIESTNNRVRVTIKVHTGVQVRTDSMATIKFTGLMGQNFVAIGFGTPDAPLAVDGATLQSVEQPDLNAVMAKLNDAATGIENFGKSFSGQNIQDLIGPLMDFVKQNSGNLGGAITNIENITGQIASGQGTVSGLGGRACHSGGAASVVFDFQGKAARLQAQADAGLGSAGVLDNVGDRFLGGQENIVAGFGGNGGGGNWAGASSR